MDPTKERKRLFERVGVQLQSSSYQGNIRVGEVCEEIAALYRAPADYRDLLSQFKLDQYHRQPVAKLSGGEKQVIALLRAMFDRPKVLIIDEGLSGLDPDLEFLIFDRLKEYSKNNSILIITHNSKTLEKCEHIYRLENGKIIFNKNYCWEKV